MNRDVALGVFDELLLRGYSPTLSSFHGTRAVRTAFGVEETREPIYNVEVYAKPSGRPFEDEGLRDLLDVASREDVKVQVFGDNGSSRARFSS